MSGPFAVPMWLIVLPDQQRIDGLVGHSPPNSLIRAGLILTPMYNLYVYLILGFSFLTDLFLDFSYQAVILGVNYNSQLLYTCTPLLE